MIRLHGENSDFSFKLPTQVGSIKLTFSKIKCAVTEKRAMENQDDILIKLVLAVLGYQDKARSENDHFFTYYSSKTKF